MKDDNSDFYCKKRFDALDATRTLLVNRARECSRLTIPSIMPPEGYTENDSLETPNQGLGAYGVNNLAAKLLLALFPPNSPFFKFSVEQAIVDELTEKLGRDDIATIIEKALSSREYLIQREFEAMALRVPIFKALKYLIVTGNCLCVLGDGGGMKVYRLDQYVVRRDPRGMVLEICIKEKTTLDALEDDEELKEVVLGSLSVRKMKEDSPGDLTDETEELELYTYVRKEGNKYVVRQELAGIPVPGSDGEYPLDNSPFIPLRWVENEGEDYGRGHVEEYLGDFISYEALSQALFDSAGAAAKTVFLVRPSGVTDVRDLRKTPNTGFCMGDPNDISVLRVDKSPDMQIPFTVIQTLEQRLSKVFLLNSSIQRDAERVTASEVRYLAAELEDALGGIYSVLSQEFQRPILTRIISVMTANNKLPPLPSDKIQLIITTGLEALGRGHDLARLQGFLQDLGALGLEMLIPRLNIRNLIDRVATARGIDTSGLIKTEQQLAMEQQQAQQAQMLQQYGPIIAQGGMDAMVGAAVGQAKQQPSQTNE